MGERVGYPSDLSDQQWALIDPFLRAWKAKRPSPSGHEGCYDLRAIVNAMFYQNRTGEPRPGRHHRQRRRQKVPGRKRGLAVDVLGLIIAVVVTAASTTDNAIGVALLDKVVEHTPTVTHAFVDAGFKDDVMIHGAVLGIAVEQVKRCDTRPGFVPVAKRWVVEQTHGTLMLHRRLAREYEILPAFSVSHTLWASTANLTRRLTGTSTATWRTTTPAA